MVQLFPQRIGILVNHKYDKFPQRIVVGGIIEQSQSQNNRSMTKNGLSKIKHCKHRNLEKNVLGLLEQSVFLAKMISLTTT